MTTDDQSLMEQIDLEGVSFTVSNTDQPARFVLGLRKSGSTLLNRMMNFIADRNRIHAIDLPGKMFSAGLRFPDWQDKDLTRILRPGNMYLGFRAYPKAFIGNTVFAEARKVLMFRDPRDALVSQYYSDAYSHSLPTAPTDTAQKATEHFLAKREKALATDINDYVLQHAPSMDRTFLSYATVLDQALTLPLRYEEHIFQKKRMIHQIVTHFGLTLKPQATEALMGQVDVVPGSEDTKNFVRNVIPGDHRRKLRPETIEKLDVKLKASLSLFDYH